jgi:hypothetical protein
MWQGTWKLLLKDAMYGGKWESAFGYDPLAYGNFIAFKAVRKSGYVSCGGTDDPNWNPNYVWNRCGYYSFELRKNAGYVVEQPNWYTLPAQCLNPSTLSGDIVCKKSFTLAPGDKLTPTWWEPSHSSSWQDNWGNMTIDLYGLVPDTEGVSA